MDEAEQTRVVRAGNLSAKTVNIVGPIENDFTIASEPVQSLSLQGTASRISKFAHVGALLNIKYWILNRSVDLHLETFIPPF